MSNEPAAVSFVDVRYAYQPGDGGFSLDVPKLSFAFGECAAVCGLNGSGKTTLGKLAAGLLRPRHGKLLIEGEDIAGWPLGKIGGRIGYLFQEPARQIFAPTVLEETTFPLELKGMDKQRARELALAILARFGMETLTEATTYTLSRGEKQRLALAAMLVNKPDFLVLDEPTTGLDIRRRALLGDILDGLVEEGVGILLISHDATFVREHATVEYRMEKGRIV